jgi:hypothetical protein
MTVRAMKSSAKFVINQGYLPHGERLSAARRDYDATMAEGSSRTSRRTQKVSLEGDSGNASVKFGRGGFQKFQKVSPERPGRARRHQTSEMAPFIAWNLPMTKTKPKTLTAPAGISAEARERWQALVREYSIEDAAGLQLMAEYVPAFDRLRQCQAQIKRDGPTVSGRWGTKAHPLLAVERDCRAQMIACLKALNLDLEPLRDGAGRPPKG